MSGSDATDPFADLRRTSDQLARLLAEHPPARDPDLHERLRKLLDDSRVKGRDGAVGETVRRIEAEAGSDRPDRRRIGTELMRLAGAVDGAGGAVEGAEDLAETAVDLAGDFIPALLL